MIETLFAKRANATNIYTIVTINAIIFQHASLESIDTIVDAFHKVATILITEGIMQQFEFGCYIKGQYCEYSYHNCSASPLPNIYELPPVRLD